jgi:N-glycosylase/DNA lyase
MKVIEIAAPGFDLEKTLNSGQVFHWQKIDHGFWGTIGNMPVHVEQCGDILKVRFGGTLKPARETPVRLSLRAGSALPVIVANYFALDHPVAEICRSFPNDKAMNAARAFCRGLRIIRQPKWECLATFICSSMKQVAHIRQISLGLRKCFGKARRIDTHVVHTFPTPQRIADSSEKQLRECALGYRARNLLATAELVSSGKADLEAWARLPDLDLRTRLCALPGVGAKVANCVMLFAYERLRAFPVDVWIERVLKKHYFSGEQKVTPMQLRRFCESYFGDHGGYAQQYLFHHARMTSRKARMPRDSSTTLRSARNDKREGARATSRKSRSARDFSRLRSPRRPAARQATALRRSTTEGT